MQNRLGWLWALLFAVMAGGGWAESTPSTVVEATATASAKAEGYRFDADRFARAMDRAAGQSNSDASAADSSKQLQSASLTGILGKTVLSLLVVVGVIYGLTYALRRIANQTPFQTAGPLRILARQGLSQKSNVYVVSALNRFLIIGESPQGLTCLSEFTDADEVEELRREWGWDPGAAPKAAAAAFNPRTLFAPALKSHMDDLERELRTYEEARR